MEGDVAKKSSVETQAPTTKNHVHAAVTLRVYASKAGDICLWMWRAKKVHKGSFPGSSVEPKKKANKTKKPKSCSRKNQRKFFCIKGPKSHNPTMQTAINKSISNLLDHACHVLHSTETAHFTRKKRGSPSARTNMATPV